MREQMKEYAYLFRDYWYDFARGFKLERLGLIGCIAVAALYTNGTDVGELKWMGMIPIAFAIISGAFHLLSLPMMMYLVPYTQQEREAYIQRMLYMKMGVPFTFALIWDGVAILLQQLSLYHILLQLLTVLLITYIMGTLNDGTVEAQKKKSAYGDIRDYVAIPLMICYVGGAEIGMVCMDSISKAEFLWIFVIMLISGFFMVNLIRKRWKAIRANFANYEMITKTEVRRCR